jgi:3-hydroxyacyl-CoA dehydrogenase
MNGKRDCQVCAQSGIQVFMADISQDILNRALKNISWSLSKFIEEGKVSENLETIMSRIRTSMDFAAGGQVDLAIEAVFERLDW